MPRIIPIKDLKNTSDISDMCHNLQEPIYITFEMVKSAENVV